MEHGFSFQFQSVEAVGDVPAIDVKINKQHPKGEMKLCEPFY